MAFNTAGAAAGAAAGAVAGPWGAAIGGIAGGFMGGGGTASGSGSAGGAAAQPQASQAAAFGSGLDGSGWVIQFGDGNESTLDNRQNKRIDSTGPSATANPSASSAARSPYGSYADAGAGYGVTDPLGLGALGLGGVPPMMWLVLAGAVVWKLSKSRK